MRNAWAWLAGAAGATALAVAVLVVLPRPEMPQLGGDAPAPSVAVSEPAAVSPAPDPVVTLDPPEIQSLRVERDGLSVISGRARAGDDVAILLDGAELARAQAGPDGLFAAIVTLPPDPAPRMLALLADPDGVALPSDGEVLIAPRAAPVEPAEPAVITVLDADAAEPSAPDGPDLALADPVLASPDEEERGEADMDEPAPESAEEAPSPVTEEDPPEAPGTGQEVVSPAQRPDLAPPAPPGMEATAPAAPGMGSEVEIAPAPPAVAEPPLPPSVAQIARAPDSDELPGAIEEPVPLPDISAVTPGQPDAPESVPPPVLALDSQGVRLLAPPPSVAAPDVIALDVIAYDPEGEVSLGGRAGQEGFVRVYLDNAAVAATTVMDGRWSVALPDEVVPGTYTLRVDEVDAAGEVVSRIESPFLRESPESLAAAMAEGAAEAGGVSVRTVQPGNSLWRIARERYGRGILYVQVFEANRDRIRNPHLIYPGQVFLLPEIGEDGPP